MGNKKRLTYEKEGYENLIEALASPERVTIKDCDFQDVCFFTVRNTTFENCRFKGTASFSKAINCSFIECDFQKTIVTFSEFERCRFEGDTPQVNEGIFSNVSFYTCTFVDTLFSDTLFSNVRFMKTKILESKFMGCSFVDVSFGFSHLEEVLFDESKFLETDMADARLRGVNLLGGDNSRLHLPAIVFEDYRVTVDLPF